MSYSGDAAEQVVRMTLEGTEVAAKITGAGAKEIAKMLYAVLRDQKKTKGKTRLANMIRSGKDLKVFAVKDEDLAKFCLQAKQYGVLYCVLKDRDAKDGITDVMVRAGDAGKVNRIFERFHLTTVDMASVRSEIEHAKQNRDEELPEPERPGPRRSREDLFLDALLADPNREDRQTANPSLARAPQYRQSVPSSKNSPSEEAVDAEPVRKRPSVREELKQIREEMKRRDALGLPMEPLQHIAPPTKKGNITKER